MPLTRHPSRRPLTLLTLLGLAALAPLPLRAQAQSLLTQRDSAYSVAETVQRLEQAIAARGLLLLAKIDHAAAAAGIGLVLRPTTVLLFGNPKGSTPLMQLQATLAIDLPLKALVWQGDDGKVRVAVNAADFYTRHGLSAEQAQPLGGVAGLVDAALK